MAAEQEMKDVNQEAKHSLERELFENRQLQSMSMRFLF